MEDVCFPIYIKKKIYYTCVNGKSGNWCPTSLTKRRTQHTWGYCINNRLTKKKNMETISDIGEIITLKLYQMTKDITELFDKYNITYWADGGTFLGAIRHGGIIPWDDDVDLATVSISEKKIKRKNFISELSHLGYQLLPVDFGFKIYPINGIPIKVNTWQAHIGKFKKKKSKY